jgi:glycosyltransferase involved in cell wall biosynthesis
MSSHPAFRRADLVIFHWGIAYDLFDALAITPSATRHVAVHFHNVTPPELLTAADREKSVRSTHQALSLSWTGAEVWTYSEYNRRALRELGVGAEQLHEVPITVKCLHGAGTVRARRPVRLLTVGRLVPSKGVHVLLDALTRLPDTLRRDVAATIVANRALSDQSYVESVRSLAASSPVDVELVENPDDHDLGLLYSAAHVVVSPSFHEGLCVPIIEGYRAGCRAIGTTGGNLPFAVFPPDPVVPTGDADALAAAIADVVRQVLSGTVTDRSPALAYARQFDQSHAWAALHARLDAICSRQG